MGPPPAILHRPAGAGLGLVTRGAPSTVIAGSELAGIDPGVGVASTRFAMQGNRGLRLGARRWDVDDPKAVVVFAHGYTAHMHSYRNVIEYLVASGFAVYAIDHRGHGASEGKRASLDRFDDLTDDFERLAELAKTAYPDVPVFTVGHSMGGLVVVRHALHYADGLAGTVSVSPALIVGEGISERTERLLIVLSWIAPNLPLISGDHREDVADGEEPAPRLRDIFSYHGRVRLNMARELRLGGLDALDRIGELQLPILLQHGTLDDVTSPNGSIRAFERASSEDRSLELWENRHHNLVTDEGWEDVLLQIDQWLTERVRLGSS